MRGKPDVGDYFRIAIDHNFHHGEKFREKHFPWAARRRPTLNAVRECLFAQLGQFGLHFTNDGANDGAVLFRHGFELFTQLGGLR